MLTATKVLLLSTLLLSSALAVASNVKLTGSTPITTAVKRILATNPSTEPYWAQIGNNITTIETYSAKVTKFGVSVSLSEDGKRIAIGCPDLSSGGTGFVQVFDNVGDDESALWVQVGTTEQITGPAGDRKFGRSVSLSKNGKRVAVGTRSNTGVVKIYQEIVDDNGDSGWAPIGQDIEAGADEPNGKTYSITLSKNGRRVAIDYFNSVQVYEFETNEENGDGIDNGEWKLIGVIPTNPVGNSGVGSTSFAQDGQRLAIGQPFDVSNGEAAGLVLIYDYQNRESWVQVGNTIEGKGASEFSGFSVSICEEGHRIAIGVPQGREEAAYDGSNIGLVRVFELVGDSWKQIGLDIDNEAGLSLESSGWSVSLSANGKRVAIGAPFDGNSGSARVFEEVDGVWKGLGKTLDYGHHHNEGSFGYSVAISDDGKKVAVGDPDSFVELVNDEGWSMFRQGHAAVYTLEEPEEEEQNPPEEEEKPSEDEEEPSEDEKSPPEENNPPEDDNTPYTGIKDESEENEKSSGLSSSAAAGISVPIVLLALGGVIFLSWKKGLFQKFMAKNDNNAAGGYSDYSHGGKKGGMDYQIEVCTDAESPNSSFDNSLGIRTPVKEEKKTINPSDYVIEIGTE